MLDRIRRSTALQRMARSIHPANVKRAVLDRAFPYTFTSCEEAFGKNARSGSPFLLAQKWTSVCRTADPATIEMIVPERRCRFLENAILWPATAMAANDVGQIAIETEAYAGIGESMKKFGFLRHDTMKREVLPVAAGFESGGFWRNYYHFMIDAIPRLWGLHTEECRRFKRIEICCVDAWGSMWRPLVEAMLPQNARLLPMVAESRARCRILISSPALACFEAAVLPKPYLDFFLARAREVYGFGLERASKRIYISRRLARMRRVANEAAIMRILKPEGFELYELESLSFADQFRLFSTAEVIVGPHGAGMTNIMAAPPGCKVIEFFPGTVCHHYRWLARACDHEYGCVAGEGRDRNVVEFTVDLEKLQSLLE